MPQEPVNFPFSAIVGMDNVKKALICAMINPQIKSVLIRGKPGTAKSVLARSISNITGKKLVNIPINATDEQIFGGLDIENTLNTGEMRIQYGLLRCNDAIIYIDDVNHMNQNLFAGLVNSIITGKVIVERGQISDSYDCSATLISTMDPNDSDLSSHMLDRFDLCAYTDEEKENNAKIEILKRNTDFANDPISFCNHYSESDQEIADNIERARAILPIVTISDELMNIVSELCYNMGVEGYRGDIAMVNTSCTLAALNGRDEVTKKDVEEAAILCLPHRRNYMPDPPPQSDEEPDEEPQKDDDTEEQESEEQEQPDNGREQQDTPETNDDEQDDDPVSPDLPSLQEMMFNIGEQFRIIDYLDDNERLPSRTKSRKGRRAITESGDQTGRYVRSKITDYPKDIAFDSTIRAAAPYQRSRTGNGLAITIEKQDLREKVRERHSGCTLLFLVDASGSLGVRRRMVTVKGTIMSMLRESYVKRDRIGMMAFRRDTTETILPPTKSVEYSYKKLEDLPTGGKTPLSDALMTVNRFMTSYSRCHPGERCFIILVTDGRANVPLKKGEDANKEASELAEKMCIPGVRWIVVDVSIGFPHFDNAEILSRKLEAKYFRLEELNADILSQGIKAAIDS